MSTRHRRRKRDARIAKDREPVVRLTFPDGTPEAFGLAFIGRIPWTLTYEKGVDANGKPCAQAVYFAPKPFSDLRFINGSTITFAQMHRAIEFFRTVPEFNHGA